MPTAGELGTLGKIPPSTTSLFSTAHRRSPLPAQPDLGQVFTTRPHQIQSMTLQCHEAA